MQPRAVYNAIWTVTGLAFGMVSTIGAVYRVREAGLDAFELVLVGTTLELTILVFEVPTGVVADVVSRRLSVVIGAFVVGAGFLLEGAVPALWSVLLAQVVWGFGYTFISGANTAWLADELGDEEALAPALLRGTQWYQGSLLAGIGLGGVLALADLQVPVLAAGALFGGLGVVLALRMEEHGFQPAPREERQTFSAMARTFGEGVRVVRGRPVLVLLLAAAAFGGAASETVDRLWQVRFLDDFDIDAVLWFGVLNGVWAVVGITGSEIVRRRGSGAPQLLVALEVTRLAGLGVFALAGRLDLAVVGFVTTQASRQVAQPLLVAWLNTRLQSSVRATVNSILGQVDAVGQLAGGPLLGLLARRASVATALAASAILLVPAVAFMAAAAARVEEPAALP
jgi:DHA3 family tetracycline resistance protein-like MFS transporter